MIGMCDRDTNSESVAEYEQTSRAHLRELAKLIQVSDNIGFVLPYGGTLSLFWHAGMLTCAR